MSPHATTSFRSLPASLAEAVTRLDIRPRRPVQGRGEGLHRSPEFGASVEFAEYRDYTPGDPLSRIDWAVYARSDRYRVRRFQEETSLRAALLLDTSASMDFHGQGLLSKWEYACQLAAGTIYALVRQGDSATLYATGNPATPVAPPVGHITTLTPTLSWLDSHQPAGRTQLAHSISSLISHVSRRSLIIIISDFLEDSPPIVRAFRQLYHEGHSLIALHISDSTERTPNFDGPVELTDSETNQRLVVEINEIRARYEEAFINHNTTLRTACNASLGDYHFIDTRQPPATALRCIARGGRQ